jgi:signal transduction histidine kinase
MKRGNMDTIKKKIYLFKFVAIIFIFLGTILFENFHTNRLYFFIGIFMLLFIIQFFKSRINSKYKVQIYLLELILIFVLEYYSRYAINYFIHSLFILLIFDASINLEKKCNIIFGILLLSVASYKYIYIINIKRNIDSIAQYFLFITLNISILVVLNLVKSVNESKIKQKNLYEELKITNKQIAELSAIKERNKISREIHDSLGHHMINIIMQLELVNLNKDLSLIPSVIDNARNTQKILRNIVEDIYRDLSEDEDDLLMLINNFTSNTKILIDFDMEKDIYYPKTIYKIIQESLTNIAKHSKATKVEIKLSSDNDFLYFYIKDNGIGCNDIKNGIGLKGMMKRVELLEGEVKFLSENGFEINGFIGRIKND